MKKSEVKEGRIYLAKICDSIVPVRLVKIDFQPPNSTRYEVENLVTDRPNAFYSARKFRAEVSEDYAARAKQQHIDYLAKMAAARKKHREAMK